MLSYKKLITKNVYNYKSVAQRAAEICFKLNKHFS